MVFLKLKCFILSALYTCAILGILESCEGKPATNSEDGIQLQLQNQPVFGSQPRFSNPTISRRLHASRTDEDLWSASAHLPSSFFTPAESEGSEHKRTKTDRDLTIGRDDDKNRDSLNNNDKNSHNMNKKDESLPPNNNSNNGNGQSSNNNKNTAMPRNHRRLTKWVKSSEDGGTAAEDTNAAGMETDKDEGSLLYQSLKTMETHLLDTDKPEDSLENSSEKDIYLQDGAGAVGGGEEQDSDEDGNINDDEDSNGNDPKSNDIDNNRKPTLTLIEGGGDVDNHNNLPATNNKEKSESISMSSYKKQQHLKLQQATTPKGLTTWSAVQVSPSALGSGAQGMPHRGSVQKIPSDYTISSSLVFSTASTTSKPITTADIVTKDKGPMSEIMITTTTMPMPISSSADSSGSRVPNRPHNSNKHSGTSIKMASTSMNVVKPPIRRKPVGMGMGMKKPPKYVKAPLDDVHASVISSDENYDTYVVKTVTDAEMKTSTPDEPVTRPPWPFMTTKRTPFSKIKTTARPIKNAYLKRTQTPILTLTTPTTTMKPQTTTVYYRNPAPSLISAFPISFTNNMSFFDFIRTQIVPRIGLSLISFMATSPLILTLLGATVGRKKRDLTDHRRTDERSPSSGVGDTRSGGDNVKYTDKLPKELEELAKKWQDDLANNFKSSAFTSTNGPRATAQADADEGHSADNYNDDGTSTSSSTRSPVAQANHHHKRYRIKKTKKNSSNSKIHREEDDGSTLTTTTTEPTLASIIINRQMNQPGTSPLRVYNVAAIIFQQLFSQVREYFTRRQDQGMGTR